MRITNTATKARNIFFERFIYLCGKVNHRLPHPQPLSETERGDENFAVSTVVRRVRCGLFTAKAQRFI